MERRRQSKQAKRHLGFLVDEALYNRFAVLARNTGISMSAGVERGLRQMIRENRIPDLIPSIEPLEDPAFNTADAQEEINGLDIQEVVAELRALRKKVEQLHPEGPMPRYQMAPQKTKKGIRAPMPQGLQK